MPKSLRKSKKNKTAMPNLETMNIDEKETDDVMSVNKRKNSRSKTRKSTKKRKDKKRKSTKFTANGDEE